MDGLGYAIAEYVVLPPEGIRDILKAVDQAAGSGISGKRGGTRGLLAVPAVRELACSLQVRELVDPILGESAFPVRAIFFDKTSGANWKVPWHQDLMIPVQRKIDIPGYTSWSVKEGVAHAQPPDRVLQQMLAVRIHLDNCGMDDGPLRVIPGSHVFGKLADSEIDRLVAQGPVVTCCVPAGGAMLMRPLTVHSSSAAIKPSHRRVIHLDFATGPLEGDLEWAGRTGS